MPGSEADLGFSGEGQSLLASWGVMDKLSRLSNSGGWGLGAGKGIAPAWRHRGELPEGRGDTPSVKRGRNNASQDPEGQPHPLAPCAPGHVRSWTCVLLDMCPQNVCVGEPLALGSGSGQEG